ncbi:related to SIP2-dominant suppressor of some ts mutations in RPO21 and PRP4 [Rhynchosporium secalis]|uniref:Related to SIP2-dominant suppressor of some ts mutations in RPO21 and PRP4 n=1 Tax=Rhynchosporium secalis TaxID=38038 RepID=A0A1E1MAR2_RHYSE|nr:related to SIP2-dominant suppressor of some ts mutations in RPO21 and PRP4 [Rhynchosporium secalis]
MGNNPSANSKSHSASASSSSNSPSPSPSNGNHESSSRPSSTRRDPRNLIQAQRAQAEPSLAQARGTTAHRPRNSQSRTQSQVQSHTAPQQVSSSQNNNTPSPYKYSSEPQMGVQQSKEEIKVESTYEPSKPVNVPVSAPNVDVTSSRSYPQSIEPSGPPATQDMSYHLTRPPRLPLPIEEEVHAPGSPMLAPADMDVSVLDVESLDHEPLGRRTSALSTSTVDEEDAEELRIDKDKATVPTAIEWQIQNDEQKVYVTGTIFQWNKKYRLHPINGRPGVLRSVIHVKPGTHHVRFIVDGVMTCSKNIPTTVDFGNNLVNYIEVSADDIPLDTPATAIGIGTPVAEFDPEAKETLNDDSKASEEEVDPKLPKVPKTKPVLPPGRYSSQVPQYLLDLDKAEDSSAYQYAAAAIEKLPTPPSLPGFLGKPLLNAATPMKDDNSVLIMPNHTVLNHLATSSIKNNVLAVSATTRYKRKYVTTIMYKPTGED